MNGLIEFETKTVRFVGTPDDPEWVAADVCQVIGLNDNVANHLRNMGPTERGINTINTSTGVREVQTVKEPGLYRLVFKSRKPEAQAFLRFVTHEVLPSIRQHGCYPPPELSVRNQAIIRLDEEVLGRAIGDQLRDVLAPISNDVQDVKADVTDLKRDVGELRTEVSKIHKRRDLRQETKALHCQVVYRKFDRLCPCCLKVEIVNSSGFRLSKGQFDHYRRRDDRSKGATWIVCEDCNQQLRDTEFHSQKRREFERYQSMREVLENTISPMLPGMEDAIT